jgi:hypothetical protein
MGRTTSIDANLQIEIFLLKAKFFNFSLKKGRAMTFIVFCRLASIDDV